MRLVDVYSDPQAASLLLLLLLYERQPNESISHKEMPTKKQHDDFFASRPYKAWYLIEHDGVRVGACYLTERNEIGIGIFKKHRGNGYARWAILAVMNTHGAQRYLANINPDNERSLSLFDRIGFEPLQVTLAIDWSTDIGPQ